MELSDNYCARPVAGGYDKNLARCGSYGVFALCEVTALKGEAIYGVDFDVHAFRCRDLNYKLSATAEGSPLVTFGAGIGNTGGVVGDCDIIDHEALAFGLLKAYARFEGVLTRTLYSV